MSRITDDTNFKANPHNIQKGTVTVVYNNGREDDFDNIDRGQFHQWAAKGYDPLNPPTGIRIASSTVSEAEQALNPTVQTTGAEIEAAQQAAHEARRRAQRKKENDEYYRNEAEKKQQQEQQRLQDIEDLGFKIEDV